MDMSFITKITADIIPLIQAYGAFGMFLGGFIEELISLIPSSLVQFTGGAILMNHDPLSLISLFKLFLVVAVPTALGVTLGSLPYFYLSKYGGTYLIEKYGKWVGFNKTAYQKFLKKIDSITHDELLFFALRVTPIFPALFVNIYAGFIQMSLRKYLVLTIIGTTIRAFIIGFVGWQLGNNVDALLKYKYPFIIFCILIILFYSGKYLLKEKKTD